MENKENVPLLQNEEPTCKGEKIQEKEHAAEGKENVNRPQPVMGIPVRFTGNDDRTGDPTLSIRQPWSTGICCCCEDDEFCINDMQVCLLGTFAPCVLYGQNMNRRNPGHHSLMYHCCVYTSLLAVSGAIFRAGFLAQWYSTPGRTALRKAYNLEGYSDCCLNNVGCCLAKSEANREECDSICDFAVHCCCHGCALCQEGREIHRRTTQSDQDLLHQTSAPSKQTMD